VQDQAILILAEPGLLEIEAIKLGQAHRGRWKCRRAGIAFLDGDTL
jgi:hypothetical protein